MEVAAATGPESGPDRSRRGKDDLDALIMSRSSPLLNSAVIYHEALPSQGYFWVERDIPPALYSLY